MLKRILAGVIVAVMLAGAAVAGPVEDAEAAFERGDHGRTSILIGYGLHCLRLPAQHASVDDQQATPHAPHRRQVGVSLTAPTGSGSGSGGARTGCWRFLLRRG